MNLEGCASENRVFTAFARILHTPDRGKFIGNRVPGTEGSDPPVVIFEYQKTRAAYHAKDFLEDYHGYLCCDGYDKQ